MTEMLANSADTFAPGTPIVGPQTLDRKPEESGQEPDKRKERPEPPGVTANTSVASKTKAAPTYFGYSRADRRELPSIGTVFVLLGFSTAVLLFLVYSLDIIAGFPFERSNILVDVSFIICSLLLGYVSWDTWRGPRQQNTFR